MLILKSIVKATDKVWNEKHLVVMHLTKVTNSLLAASFAADDFAVTAHLDQMTDTIVSDSGNVDYVAMLNKVNERKGEKIAEMYGFSIAISDILEGVQSVHFAGTDDEMRVAKRNVVGVGSDEASARAEAISRERARLTLQHSKGKCDYFYAEDEES